MSYFHHFLKDSQTICLICHSRILPRKKCVHRLIVSSFRKWGHLSISSLLAPLRFPTKLDHISNSLSKTEKRDYLKGWMLSYILTCLGLKFSLSHVALTFSNLRIILCEGKWKQSRSWWILLFPLSSVIITPSVPCSSCWGRHFSWRCLYALVLLNTGITR